MALWTDLFPTPGLVKRTWYVTPGSGIAIVVPAGATAMRASMVGGGGMGVGASRFCGDGAAFARTKLTGLSAGAAFTLQIGRAQPVSGVSVVASSALEDSILTRNSDSAVICKAARGADTGPGLVANCVGDVKRAGSAGVDGNGYPSGVGSYPRGGASAGDDADVQALGFGGPGAIGISSGQSQRAAYPGAGGCTFYVGFDSSNSSYYSARLLPGDGRACIEFFTMDPGY